MSHHRTNPIWLSVSICLLLGICFLSTSKAYSCLDDPVYPPTSDDYIDPEGRPFYPGDEISPQYPRKRNIAIIGGGFSGIIFAHFFSDEHEYSPEVTIFEREPRLGGRVHTVRSDHHKGQDQIFETGGNMFDAWDQILERKLEDAGVTTHYIHDGKSPLAFVSAWDGEKLELSEDDQLASQLDTVPNMLWYHGLSFRVWKKLWHQIWHGEPGIDYLPIHWRNSVRKEMSAPGLRPKAKQLNELARSWGLKTEPQKQANSLYGMENILHRLTRIAGSSVHLDSTVTRIKRHGSGESDVYWTHVSPEGLRKEYVETFGAVIIAAPFHQTDIEFEPPLPDPPVETEYKSVHVTHFITERELDPTTFNLPKDGKVPDTIWDIRDRDLQESETTSTPSFLTLTRETSSYLSGCLLEKENVYRILSEQIITDNDIATFLNKTGVPRGDITFPDQHCDFAGYSFDTSAAFRNVPEPEESREERLRKISNCQDEDTTVRWIHRRAWPNAMPIVHDNATSSTQRIQLTPELYYLSDFERTKGASIIQSLESADRTAFKFLEKGLRCPHPDYC
ncbi:hypothetical protein N7492_002431 [Penicillium capsulatum]|uniref:Amine oxidase domain-containing protein n=1 Tax=Penicillium capsulatum TaxID=69766 RepID=A0A9W9IP36_9EURO|nr:hypothetical protein N7492_002431 [Penicillium capsulatum]KAJ6122964.1 hypothetical protein N7512_005429 [Penicillium capsulatum]